MASGWDERDSLSPAWAPHAAVSLPRHGDAARSEREARERAEEALERAERLIGMIARTLRAPAAAIVASVESLRRNPDPAAIPNLIERVVSEARRVDRMTAELAELGRLRRGALDRAPCDLRTILEDCGAGDGQLVVRIRGRSDGVWDAVRLHRAFANLIFTGERTLVIVDGDDEGARITIQTRIRLDLPTGDVGEQPDALGVYVARAIVSAHGGTIDVRSRADTGTKLVVTLPRHVDPSV